MSRALTNAKHAKAPAGAPPFVPANQTAQLLAQYNGRLNTEAGIYENRVVKPLYPDGMTAGWAGALPPNHK